MAFLKATKGFLGQKVGHSLETSAESCAQTETGVARLLMLRNPFPTSIVLEVSLVLWQRGAPVSGRRLAC